MSEYIHGGDIYSQPVRLDFSINVNPLGIPEGVKAAPVLNAAASTRTAAAPGWQKPCPKRRG